VADGDGVEDAVAVVAGTGGVALTFGCCDGVLEACGGRRAVVKTRRPSAAYGQH